MSLALSALLASIAFLPIPATASAVPEDYGVVLSTANAPSDTDMLRKALTVILGTAAGARLAKGMADRGISASIEFCEDLFDSQVSIPDTGKCPPRNSASVVTLNMMIHAPPDPPRVCVHPAWRICPPEILAPSLAHEWLGHGYVSGRIWSKGELEYPRHFLILDELYAAHVGALIETELGADRPATRWLLYDPSLFRYYLRNGGSYAHALTRDEARNPLTALNRRRFERKGALRRIEREIDRLNAKMTMLDRLVERSTESFSVGLAFQEYRSARYKESVNARQARKDVETMTDVLIRFKTTEKGRRETAAIQALADDERIIEIEKECSMLGDEARALRKKNGWATVPPRVTKPWDAFRVLIQEDRYRDPRKWADLPVLDARSR